MNIHQYIDRELHKLTKYWLSFSLIVGALFFVLLSTLDFFVTPGNFLRFLIYRSGIALIMFGLHFINRKTVSQVTTTLLIIASAVSTSAAVELMILSFGGHQSTYYAGMIITVVFILAVIPLHFKISLAVVSIVYAVYLFPILLFDKITNVHMFISNNAFLLSTSAIALIWRFLSQKSLINELSLQYELDKDKQELETYSTQLEDLVEKRTEELSVSEKWHRSVFDNATDGIVVLDSTGKILNVNQKACEIHSFERDALIGINIELLEAQSDMHNFQRRMSRILKGESLIFETEHFRKNGNKVVLEVTSKAIDIGGETFIQSFYRDVTEKKRIQEQLMHAQRMESVGSLAGGIAHNFNNILTAILGYSELLLEFSSLDSTSRQRVRSIESAARKAGVMVTKLLSFARRESHELLPLNFNDVVNDSVRLFEGIMDRRIGLKVTVDGSIPIIEGDPNQLEQVIMNLVVNARDAMPDGGLISVETRFTEVTPERSNIPDYVDPGKYVVLTVSDTGHGISPSIAGRIFDPFFTTKEKGKGTGLGLASVYGIVKDHKGHISVKSEVEKGTCFTIYLPVSEKIVPRARPPQILSVEGNEQILLIDDDREVLNLIRDMLETHGYHVIPVNNSLTAIDLFRNNTNKIQLVITDMVMPLMEGDELIEIFRGIKPEIKIIVISGYGYESARAANLMNAFLKKPFEGIELLSTVRQVLDTKTRNLPLN